MKKISSFLLIGGGLYLLSRVKQAPLFFYLPRHLEKFRDEIKTAALKYNLDPLLVSALIQFESAGDQFATRYEKHLDDSSYGLMQILCSTAEDLLKTDIRDCSNLFDVSLNIELGSRYLRKQIDRYDGNILFGIIAYNTGSIRRDPLGQSYDPNEHFLKVWSFLKLYEQRQLKEA